ncbi:vesicle transport protein SEC20 [Bacillus rossius redtenbacheri]|uniref:vesicle transport protein SEC20 n=1 Tax=Bacillus rossius redtenbacheri TaxID=93214 RepID=UPI002FDE7A2E
MTENYVLNHIRREIVNVNLLVKALIQDINHCCGPRELLNELNSEGRAKLATLRQHINQLEALARDEDKPSARAALLEEVEGHRQQLTSSYAAFRKANVACLLSLDRADKEELLDAAGEEVALRHRQRRDKEGLVKASSSVTDQLLSISKNLAETAQRSAGTLDSLVNSSSNVHDTQQELLTTGSVILQSSKLLDKYGRREFTDKVLLFFAFAFFLACVVYIIQKRLF